MDYYNPDALYALYRAVKVSSKELSGIMGDAQHFAEGGYHVPRNAIHWDDYSVELAIDKLGDGNAASAIDIKFSAKDMKIVSQRLLNAGKNNDPRVAAMREFFGTTNGTKVIGWDRHDPARIHDDTPTTSDDSHLWHVHISIYRAYSNRTDLALKIAAVINGVPYVPAHRPTPTPTTHLHRLWPAYMSPQDYFGPITGPAHSHGGYYPSERPDVRAIQQRLQALGFAPKTTGWADGRYEQPTKDAVIRWQRKHNYPVNGLITHAGWNKLFTY